MLTKVGVIYSQAQLVLRELIICGDDDGYAVHQARMLPNEGWLEIPIDLYNSFDMEGGRYNINSVDVYIASVLGEPLSDRCAVVAGDTDIVLSVICADPYIDDHPAGIIVQDDVAVNGEVYDFSAGAP